MSEENTSTYENIEEENSIGHVQIAGEVIAIIAGLAATEVDGVSRLAGSLSNELASRLGKKNPAKGVKVELLPGEVKVDLAIDVLYEYSIPTVTTQVQDKVKQAIETMTGLNVTKVNIRVAGVRMADATREEHMTRREIRETVFKILFSLEFNDISEIREEAELELEHASLYDEDDNKMDAVAMTEEEKAYVIDRVEAVVAHITEIDETISGISQGWKLGRIGKAELAILRLAVYEIKFDEDIPVKVAINEAVELAKTYCDVEAKSFINALLAKLAD